MRKIVFILLMSSTFFQLHAQPLQLAYSKVLIYKDQMQYNPTDEFIFPCVIKATDHIANPLGKYYLYYAPHDAPAGICMAYSNSITGPFTEYANNPILSNKHQGMFNVTHVSSPQVVWMPQYQKYFLYFHGENTTTRWAHSTDGINWELAQDNAALKTSDWGADFTECSYAKVFEYTIPGIGDRYTMVMMLIKSGHGRRIGLATSKDGKKFTPRDPALITSNAAEGGQLSAPFYWANGGKHYIIYHGASGKIHYTEVGSSFNQEIHKGIFYNPAPHYPELGKAADCFLFYENNRWNMFYTTGERLKQTIAYAFEVPSTNIVIDNNSNGFSQGGSWISSSSTKGYYGPNYLHDNHAATNPGSWAKWKPTFPVSGFYKVLVRWPAEDNRPSSILYKVYHEGNVTETRRSQQTNSGSWVYLGKYYFNAGNSENNKLTLDAGSGEGYAIADAAWFILDNEESIEQVSAQELTEQKAPTLSLDETNDFEVFPNPAETIMNINSLQDLTGAEITIIDASGNNVLNISQMNSNSLDVSLLKDGIYTITVSKDGNKLSAKFIKN
ncbi:MAG: hypothetical protein K0R51_748 [Cytophagaceae bacterium]|jgi:hypothetical protein|nr:hypothetical protein [Cytophagaceae bacterium]